MEPRLCVQQKERISNRNDQMRTNQNANNYAQHQKVEIAQIGKLIINCDRIEHQEICETRYRYNSKE